MINQTSRRSFVISAGMASGATMLGGISAAFATAPVASVGSLVSSYGSKIGSRRLKNDSVEYRVEVRDYEKFANTFANQEKLAWDRVEALEGNVLKLSGRGQTIFLKHV